MTYVKTHLTHFEFFFVRGKKPQACALRLRLFPFGAMLKYLSVPPMEILLELRQQRRTCSAEEVLGTLDGFLQALAFQDPFEAPERMRHLAKKYINHALERSNNCRKSAEARWQKPQPKPEPQPEPPKATAKPKPEKHALDQGGFVRVTVDEESALRVKFGLDFGRAVQILADYKESKGKAYKSDAAAMRGWVYDRIQEDKRRTAPRNFTERQNEMVRGAKELIDDLRSGRLHIE